MIQALAQLVLFLFSKSNKVFFITALNIYSTSMNDRVEEENRVWQGTREIIGKAEIIEITEEGQKVGVEVLVVIADSQVEVGLPLF